MMKSFNKKIAYFSFEFALPNCLYTYAGGLGILAGDFILQAANENLSVVGIGLMYHEGYKKAELDKDHDLIENSSADNINLYSKNLKLVKDEQGKVVTIDLQVEKTIVKICAWVWQKGSTCVYFLDTNLPENSDSDKKITAKLYVSNIEMRFKQEMVLGLGGAKFLEKINYKPDIYHLNEGHSAFLIFELMARGIKKKIVFTNHTITPAGHDIFSKDLVLKMFENYAHSHKTLISALIQKGSSQNSNLFSMTTLALRNADKINAVSQLHHKKALELWPNTKMTFVTNGIFLPNWEKINKKAITWSKHQKNKKNLLEFVLRESGKKWKEDEILIGWARRIVEYKRPLALLEKADEILELEKKSGKRIRIIFSGSAHASDEIARKILAKMAEIIKNKLPDNVVYLQNYNLEIAKLMTSGCDIWLNTPIIGFEACGTSGMKAALNGVLPMSTKDGWVGEIDLNKIGWELHDDEIGESIIQTLEENVMPLYSKRDEKNIPVAWVEKMNFARRLIVRKFNMKRVWEEYIEKIYT